MIDVHRSLEAIRLCCKHREDGDVTMSGLWPFVATHGSLAPSEQALHIAHNDSGI